MSKNPIDSKELEKVIFTTQIIEGYKEADAEVIKKVRELREKYGIKVQSSK